MNEEEKHLIPDDILPPNMRGKGYRITRTGKFYGVQGNLLKEDFSPNGLQAPVYRGLNLWYVMGMMFNPPKREGLYPVSLDDVNVEWLTRKEYKQLVFQLTGYVVSNPPVNDWERQQILELKKQKVSDAEIARQFNINRTTVWRITRGK